MFEATVIAEAYVATSDIDPGPLLTFSSCKSKYYTQRTSRFLWVTCTSPSALSLVSFTHRDDFLVIQVMPQFRIHVFQEHLQLTHGALRNDDGWLVGAMASCADVGRGVGAGIRAFLHAIAERWRFISICVGRETKRFALRVRVVGRRGWVGKEDERHGERYEACHVVGYGTTRQTSKTQKSEKSNTILSATFRYDAWQWSKALQELTDSISMTIHYINDAITRERPSFMIISIIVWLQVPTRPGS
jgi:hypothetical protein